MKYSSLVLCFLVSSLPGSSICMQHNKFNMQPEQNQSEQSPLVKDMKEVSLKTDTPQPQTLKDTQQENDCCSLCLGAACLPVYLICLVGVFGCCLPCMKKDSTTQQPAPQN